MLRDFKLLCNASTHGYLLQLFQKYAVQVQEEREKVRAIFLYKYFNNKYEQVLTHERVSTMLKLLVAIMTQKRRKSYSTGIRR